MRSNSGTLSSENDEDLDRQNSYRKKCYKLEKKLRFFESQLEDMKCPRNRKQENLKSIKSTGNYSVDSQQKECYRLFDKSTQGVIQLSS